MADNTVQLVGNITRDPELRFLPGGSANATFGLAVNRRYNQGGEWKEETSFFDVVAWRDLAENVAQSLTKGTRVVVVGRLQQRSWETQDGDKRSKVEVIADEIGPSLRWATVQVTKTERREGGSGGGYNGGQQRQAAPASTPAADAGHDPFAGQPAGGQHDDDDEPF